MKYYWEKFSKVTWLAKTCDPNSKLVASITDYSHHSNVMGVYSAISYSFLNDEKLTHHTHSSMEDAKQYINNALRRHHHLEVSDQLKVML